MIENKKRVYRFGGKTAEGNGTMRELLGGKGANLAEMSLLGMPVPAGLSAVPSIILSAAVILMPSRKRLQRHSRLQKNSWARNSAILTIRFS